MLILSNANVQIAEKGKLWVKIGGRRRRWRRRKKEKKKANLNFKGLAFASSRHTPFFKRGKVEV